MLEYLPQVVEFHLSHCQHPSYLVAVFLAHLRLDEQLKGFDVVTYLAAMDFSHKQYSQLIPHVHMQDCPEFVCVEEEVEVYLHM